MSKFNRPTTRPTLSHPVTTTGETTTYEGGRAWTRDARSELVLLAVTNMVGEDTFYESAGDRDDRFTALVREAAVADGSWFHAFVRWLRTEANMRSASLVAAAEGVRARLEHTRALSLAEGPGDYAPEPDGWNRKTIDVVLQRPDEPGEMVAYWTLRISRSIPQPVKRGVADAVRRMYTERSLLKYDTASHGVRFADVLELTHPAPVAPGQGDLFKYALDRRHNRADDVPVSLSVIRHNVALRTLATTGVTAPLLDTEALFDAGMTWEDALSLAGDKVDKARLWEAMIPNMGIMALIRNLRNFDEAGISEAAVTHVINRLTDPEEIGRSRQFPYRFLSAYRSAPSLRWGHALDVALGFACRNIPAMTGRTLVLVDTSASMNNTVSGKSVIRHVDIGALFGVALAARTEAVDLVGYASRSFVHSLVQGGSVLKQADAFIGRVGEVGHGTNTETALRRHYDGHARVVVITDMQVFGSPWSGSQNGVSGAVPAGVPLFGVDTTGYDKTSVDTSQPNRYEIGGFSDKLFSMVAMLDTGRSTTWPWER